MRSWKEERRRRIHIFWWWLLNLHTLECLFYARMCCTPRIMISTTKQKWWEVKKKENGVDNVYALLHCQFGVFPFSSWPLPSQASAFLPLYNPKSSYNLEIQINHYSFKNHNHLRSSLVHHILTHSVVLDIKKGKIKTQNLNPANTRAFFYWLPLHCWNTFFLLENLRQKARFYYITGKQKLTWMIYISIHWILRHKQTNKRKSNKARRQSLRLLT